MAKRTRFVRLPEGRLRVPPSRHVQMQQRGYEWDIGLHETRRRACTRCLGDCQCWVTKEAYNAEVATDDPRVALIVAYLADLVHEALEWVTLDGEPFVNPHSLSAYDNGAAIIEPALRDLIVSLKSLPGERFCPAVLPVNSTSTVTR